MYRIGQVLDGAACEIDDIECYSFIKACAKYKIPVIHYNIDEIGQYQTVAQ